jgi:uncharacterized protein YndB with AHSA1/START domain
MTESPKIDPAKSVTLTLSVDIHAPKSRVWTAMIDEIDAWWLPQHRMSPSSKKMILEPRAGGRFYEDAPGGGLLWYTVQMIVPSESLDMHGYLAARYGGPAISLLHVSLTESKGVTTVTISDSLIGAFNDSLVEGTSTGWTELFNQGLKIYVEKGSNPLAKSN